VRGAYDDNVITMTQKKHDNFDYEYLAIRIWCGLYFYQLKYLFLSWYAGLLLKWHLEYDL
jgi:hypothetical protein